VIGLEGATRDTALIAQMKEIGANLLLTEHIGRAHVVGRNPADCLERRFKSEVQQCGIDGTAE